MLNKGTASLEVKNSERNRELENFASLESRVCEVLLYPPIPLNYEFNSGEEDPFGSLGQKPLSLCGMAHLLVLVY